MQHPFSVLEPEYSRLLARMILTRAMSINVTARRLLSFVQDGKYAAVSDRLGIPQIFIATSFERESSSNFRDSPAQGDPWDRVSVHVPRGRGPFPNWTAAAIDAYTLDHLDRVGKSNWTWARFCYEGELFNGFGYRAHGVHSPYDWAGSNDYTSGKYVADGVWNPNAVDQQLGIVPVARAMALMNRSLDLPGWPTATVPVDMPPPEPAPVGVGGHPETGDHSTSWLQESLNKLGVEPHLMVDGSYGRRTRMAVREFQSAHGLEPDGLAGPLTYAALERALEGK